MQQTSLIFRVTCQSESCLHAPNAFVKCLFTACTINTSSIVEVAFFDILCDDGMSGDDITMSHGQVTRRGQTCDIAFFLKFKIEYNENLVLVIVKNAPSKNTLPILSGLVCLKRNSLVKKKH